jgi:tryptophan-rich sensory protein
LKPNIFFKLVIAIVVSELAGIIGSFFTVSAIPTWYATLAKPALNPPSWIFGPVWTTLYALMGISLFLIWKNQTKTSKKTAYCLFYIQLILNAIWSVIFFYYHNIGGALVDIIFLWFAILATIVLFAKISRSAAWLLVPYILWVSFAIYLNYTILTLN